MFFGDDFVTITREQEDEDWALIKPHVFATLMDYLQSGKPVLADDIDATGQEPTDTSKPPLLVFGILRAAGTPFLFSDPA